MAGCPGNTLLLHLLHHLLQSPSVLRREGKIKLKLWGLKYVVWRWQQTGCKIENLNQHGWLPVGAGLWIQETFLCVFTWYIYVPNIIHLCQSGTRGSTFKSFYGVQWQHLASSSCFMANTEITHIATATWHNIRKRFWNFSPLMCEGVSEWIWI